MIKKIVLVLMIFSGVVGAMNNQSPATNRTFRLENIDSVSNLKCPNMCQITSVQIKNCTVDYDFVSSVFEGLNLEKVIYDSWPMSVEFLNTPFDEETREYVIDWVRSIYRGYGCILNKLYLIGCGFNAVEQEQINTLSVARDMLIL